MTKKERTHEIREIMALLDQAVTLSRHQVMEVLGIRIVLASFESSSMHIDDVELAVQSQGPYA